MTYIAQMLVCRRLTKAKLSATQDIATKQNIFDRLWDAQRVLEQLESFWREAQFAYNDLIVSSRPNKNSPMLISSCSRRRLSSVQKPKSIESSTSSFLTASYL
jgi:hypothetical protein